MKSSHDQRHLHKSAQPVFEGVLSGADPDANPRHRISVLNVAADCSLKRTVRKFNSLRPLVVVAALIVLAVVVIALAFVVLSHKPRSHRANDVAAGSTTAGSGDYLLRLSGSNTIGSQLGPMLVKAWLTAKGATDIKDETRSGPDGKPIPEQVITAQLGGKTVEVEVKAHGSATAFKDLGSGNADIGMASRAIKDDEVAQLSALGDMRGRASEHVLGLDGIAVVVPQSSPLQHLTMAQLKGLFTGQTTDWSMVGGASGPVHLYARDDKSPVRLTPSSRWSCKAIRSERQTL